MSNDEAVIGIDLGTTNSVVATLKGNKVVVIPDAQGNHLHPSVVAFVPNGDVLVGQAAKARRHVDPRNTIFSAKRLIGQSVDDPMVRLCMDTMPYICQEGTNKQPQVMVRGEDYTIPEISAIVLKYLRGCAEEFLGVSVNRAVITVPANFTDAQRQATQYAGKLAGLDVLRILNEPTAAALAYGFGKAMNSRLAVYDLGGGTFDITVLSVQERIFEVLATSGDSFLGGDDFDKAILDKLAGEFLSKHYVDLRDDIPGLSRLRAACEQIKCRLSAEELVTGTIHDLAKGKKGQSLDSDFSVSRKEFEHLIVPYIERSMVVCSEALVAAGMEASSLSDLILVGGTTRIPAVRRSVEQFFGATPQTGIHPDETVAYGAAVQAASLTHKGVGPGRFHSLLLDVCPRSLGIAVAGGYAEPIVNKNTTVPVERVRNFSTSNDGQTSVTIKICQGEERRFEDNQSLGFLCLEGLVARPRGKTNIQVTFTIDSNGILDVSALDEETGQRALAKIQVIGAPEDMNLRELPNEVMASVPV